MLIFLLGLGENLVYTPHPPMLPMGGFCIGDRPTPHRERGILPCWREKEKETGVRLERKKGGAIYVYETRQLRRLVLHRLIDHGMGAIQTLRPRSGSPT